VPSQSFQLDFQATPELREKIKNNSIIKSYQPGDVIVNENSHIRSIPLVAKGAIRVIRTEEDGREILLYYIKTGETCIMSFLGGLHHEKSKVKAEV
jgi:CRP/FNR family transcriptional regulator